jgi:glycosyltransferase involved in cell wall biosynthesis
MKHSKALRILIVIPNLGRGGAQQVFRDQLQFYSGHDYTLGCVFNFDDSFKDDQTANILSLHVPAGKNFLSKIACFFKRIVALRKIKREYNITFCISHLEGADYVNLLSKRKEKVICWIHGSKASDENIEGTLGILRKKMLIPLTYRLSDRIVTVSDGIRSELVKYFGIPLGKITTIYNSFILEDIFYKAHKSLAANYQELFSNKSVIITHCRLSRQKNLFVLIDIFVATKSQYRTKLMILGDGELREEMLSYCATHNLRIYSVLEKDLPFHSDYDIYFMGYERNPYPFLSRATLYAMTSSWEGFPLSLCEAMASGVPVISADCYTGPREIISPGLETKQPILQPVIAPYGILMPLANKETIKIWTDTLCILLKDAALRSQLKEKGKERVLAFDRKRVSAQWLDLIEGFKH